MSKHTLKRIYIFNCPPRAGKDEMVIQLQKLNDGRTSFFIPVTFKNKLIRIAMEVAGVTREEWFTRYEDGDMKEEPWDRCGGLSQRQFLIKISEDWVKPLYGNFYFGQALVDLVVKNFEGRELEISPILLVPDGGFEDEVTPLIDNFGSERVRILQWTRGGRDFSKDSRDWLRNYPDITVRLKDNDSTIEAYAEYLHIVIASIETLSNEGEDSCLQEKIDQIPLK